MANYDIEPTSIVEISQALERLVQLDPKEYAFKGPANPGRRFGIFENAVKAVFPNIVVDRARIDDTERKLLKPSTLVPVIIAALKQMYQREFAKPITIARSATVAANGNAVFFLTDDNTATGKALFSSVNASDVVFMPSGTLLPHSFAAPTISSDLKTLTVAVSRSASVQVLSIQVLAGTPILAVGSTVKASITGQPAA